MKQVIIFVVVMLIFPVSAVYGLQADEENMKHPIDVWTERCLDNNPSTAGTVECARRAYDKWDEELNKVYQGLRKELSSEGKNILRDAQRAWLTYRDAEFRLIDAIYGSLQGTMWISAGEFQKVEIVKKRTLLLRSYLDDVLFNKYD